MISSTRAARPFLSLLLACCFITGLLPSIAQADFIDHFANLEDIGAAKVPSMGDARILVLTIEVEGYPPLPLEEIREYFDPVSVDGEPRFTDFYTRMSRGLYRPVAEVAEPLHFDACPLPEDYFGYEDCEIPRGGGNSSADKLKSLEVGLILIEEIMRRADEELDLDFSRYDTTGPEGVPDGWIDGVLLMHNINFGGIALPIYALRRDGRLEFDGVGINIVGISESPAVALHEFGHLLGWADLYDESRATKGLQYSHMSSWDDEDLPPALDAFSRIAVGWTEPMEVLEEGDEKLNVRLPPAVDSGAVIQVGVGDEYFLIENRGRVEGDYIDGGVQARGLAIYHVNLKKYPSTNDGQWILRLANCLNCDPWKPMLMNEQADGLFELQLPGTRRDDRGDLFQEGDRFVPSSNTRPLSASNKLSSSNFYDGAVTGVSVTNIRQEGDDMVFDVRIDKPCDVLACEHGCEGGRCLEPDPTETPDEETPNSSDMPVDESEPPVEARKLSKGCSTSPSMPSTPLKDLGLVALAALGLVALRRR